MPRLPKRAEALLGRAYRIERLENEEGLRIGEAVKLEDVVLML